MKKLGKISINPEKVIKNEELVNLKGGDYSGPCCICNTGHVMLLSSEARCNFDCYLAGYNGGVWLC